MRVSKWTGVFAVVFVVACVVMGQQRAPSVAAPSKPIRSAPIDAVTARMSPEQRVQYQAQMDYLDGMIEWCRKAPKSDACQKFRRYNH